MLYEVITERNYKFKEIKTELCYKIIQKWIREYMYIYYKRFIIMNGEIDSNNLLHKRINKSFEMLFNVDITFFIELCEAT